LRATRRARTFALALGLVVTACQSEPLTSGARQWLVVPGVRIGAVDSTTSEQALIERNGSRWRTAAWVHVGTTLRELEALNSGRPLRFMGFAWDYGGTGSWSEQGAGRMRIVLHPDSASWATGSRDPRAGEIMGDREVSSSHPLIRRMNVRVERMSIHWTEPQVQYPCPGL
jgi:hypothetical protein